MQEHVHHESDSDRITPHLLACTVTILLGGALCLALGLASIIYSRFAADSTSGPMTALLIVVGGLVSGVACTLFILFPVALITETLARGKPLVLRALLALAILAALLLVLGFLVGLVWGGAEGTDWIVYIEKWGMAVMTPALAFYALILRLSPSLLRWMHRRMSNAKPE